MLAYLVTAVDFSEFHVFGVYSTPHKAYEAIRELRAQDVLPKYKDCTFHVYEYVVDAPTGDTVREGRHLPSLQGKEVTP